MNWGQAVKTITDGSADAVVLPILFPDSLITQALASGNMTVWSVPKANWESEGFQKYLKAPGSAPFTLDASRATLGEGGVTLVTEDGIRDQPRSRGLGDVYKRQALVSAAPRGGPL